MHRPRAEWIVISCPAIIADQTFKASTDNMKGSPCRVEPGAWLLRVLVKCRPAAGHQLPQDARPQRHLALLLQLP